MKQTEIIAKASTSLKAVAAFTLISFILTQTIIPAPTGFAQNSNVPGGDPVSVSTAQVLNSMIAVPPELGKIEESFQGTSGKTILFIQDAHDSLEAQENIAKLIDGFVEKDGIKTVFEEGYEGPVPTDEFFGFIKDPKIKQKVSYFLLDKLRLGGAEYAHVNRTHDFKLIGVESLKLYAENIKAYRDSSQNREETEADLNKLFAQISVLANRHFPKELKSWLRSKERSSKGELPLLSYLKELRALYLKAVADPVRFPLEYPALSILLAVETTKNKKLIEQLNALDSKLVFEEMNRLEKGLSNALLQNDRDKQIFDYYQGLTLLKRLNQIQLTQSEYDAAKETLHKVNTRKLADFVVLLTRKSLLLSKEWERHIKDAMLFYDVAQSRDVSINKCLTSYIESKKEKTVALVFGGFHATAIKEVLRQQEISYVIISPRITKIEKRHQDYYRELMSVGHYPFETHFLVTRANKPPSVYFTAAVIGEDAAIHSELRAIASAVATISHNPNNQLIEQNLVAEINQDKSAAKIRSEMRNEMQQRKSRFDRLFFDQGVATGFLRNFSRHFSAIQALVKGEPVTPVSIEIQPSGTCNINCRFCGFGEQRALHRKMNLTVEQMEHLIQDIQEFNRTAPHPMTEIKFNGIFSDPLAGAAKKATVRGLELAVAGNFWTGLFTNGIELSEEVQRALVGGKDRSAAFVNISLDASTWENYHRIKKQGGSPEASKEQYLKILQNIRELVKMKKRMGSSLNISISSVLQEENTTPEEVEGLVRLARELGVNDVRFRYPYKKMTGAPQQSQIQAAYETLQRLIEEYRNDPNFSVTQVYTDDETHELMGRLLDGSLQRKKYEKCHVPHLRLTVSSDGQFHPCDHRGYITGGSLGSLEDGYRAVMEGMTRKEFIDGIHPQKDPQCSFCAMYNHYTNELVSVLMAEYEQFPGVFDWLRKEYNLDEQGRTRRLERTPTDEEIEQNIGRRIAVLSPHLRSLFEEVGQDITKHAEGPTLRHHLQVMLRLLDGAAQNTQIPPAIRKVLADPKNYEFFVQFILFHDIGKKVSQDSRGKTTHEIESVKIAEQQAFPTLDTYHREVLLKAIRNHMAMAGFQTESAEVFEKFMREIGLSHDSEAQALLVAAVYLDGRSTWSNKYGDFNLPQIRNFCKSYELYVDFLVENKTAVSKLSRTLQEAPQGQSLHEFLNYLTAHPFEPRQHVDVKAELLPPSAYRSRLQKLAQASPSADSPKNAYRGYVSGAAYDPWEMLNAVFRDEEFLSAFQYLVLSEDGRTRLKFEDQPALKRFIEGFVERRLAGMKTTSPVYGAPGLAQALSEEFAAILACATEIHFPYYPNDTKDVIKEYFPNYLRFLVQKASGKMGEQFPGFDSQLALRWFSDLVLETISYKLDSMQAYREFLPRQLYIVLSAFDEELHKFSGRVGFGDDFVPVYLLKDAEPLAYSTLGLLGRKLREAPEFVYLNRLSTLSFRERMEYYGQGLDGASDFSKTVFAKTSRFYGFWAGDPEKGIPSAFEQIRDEAASWAQHALQQFLKSRHFESLNGEKERRRILGEGLNLYRDVLERYMIVLTAERLLQFSKQDREAESIVENIASFFIPESLKGDSKKKGVFIDSGFKGTFPSVLAGLLMLGDLKEQGNDQKLAAIERLKGNVQDVQAYPLRGRAFLYGTDPGFRSAVPNAGFQRFGFGGVNTFIEVFPKFVEFDSLSAKGIAQMRLSGDYQMRLAQDALEGLKRYAGRVSAMPTATDFNELLSAIESRASSNQDPLLLFLDLDNVVLQPRGYVGSEYWYGDMTSEILDRDREAKARHFEYYKRFSSRLNRIGGYEKLVDTARLREELQKKFPGRPIRIVAFSARNETQRPATLELLDSLGITGQFDEINLSERPGMRKTERLLEYLVRHGYRDAQGMRANAFVVDDLLHNLAPLLELNDRNIIPVMFDAPSHNERWKGGSWFFELGYESLRAGRLGEAEQFFTNAFKNTYIPLTVSDLAFYSEGDSEFLTKSLIPAVSLSAEWLDEKDAARLTALIKQLLNTELGRRHANDFYDLATQLHRKTGLFVELLKSLYASVFLREAPEPEASLWQRMEEAGKNFEKSRSVFEQQGLSKGRVIENALLDNAYEWANRVSPAEFAVIFVRLLAPYFDKTKLISFMPQNAVFREQFQWLEVASDGEYEFFYGGKYYHFNRSEVRASVSALSADSYPELKVKLLNRLFSKTPIFKLPKIHTAIVFPSLYCAVGCPICLFRAPREPLGGKQKGMYLTPEEVSKTIALVNANPDIQTLVLGGGGEPLGEEDAIMRFVAETRVKKIKIYSSANWGQKKSEIHRILFNLHQAVSKRNMPVELELNISADHFHVRNIAGEKKVEYLVNILDGFLEAQKRGRLQNASLVFRGLSQDGEVPKEPDVIHDTIRIFKERYPTRPVDIVPKVPDGYALLVDGKANVRVSYNKMISMNQRHTLSVVEEMSQDTQSYELDRIFVNSDASVSLGGYYKAVPIADLSEASSKEIWELAGSNLVSMVAQREGLAYLWRIASEFTPQLASNPPPISGKIELVKTIMRDPQRQLYIYYRIISDLHKKGFVADAALSKSGLRPGISSEEIKALASTHIPTILRQDRTKKLNWGFSPKPASETMQYRNIWWDASDEVGKAIISKRIDAIQDTSKIEVFVKDILKKKYGIEQPQISSMTVVGGYIANRSQRFPVKDLDLIVTVPHVGIRDFVPESPFVFENTFRQGIDGIPGKICVWIVSDGFFNASTSNIIDVDLALTVLSGIPIKGSLPNSQPAPIIERVKQAFLFLNLLLKMNADLEAGKIFKRRLEIKVILEQLRQITHAPTTELAISPNISDLDKPELPRIQEILKDVFAAMKPLDLKGEWESLDRLFDLEHRGLHDGKGTLAEVERKVVLAEKRRQVMEEAIQLRQSLQSLLERLYTLQAPILDKQPVQESRAWLIDIFKANTASRSLEEHVAIASFDGIDYSTALSLAMNTPYPAVLSMLYNNITATSSPFAKKPSEKSRILSVLSSNPALPLKLRGDAKLNEAVRSEARSMPLTDLLLPPSYHASEPYRERLLDAVLALNFGEWFIHADAEKNLSRKEKALRERLKVLGDRGIPREKVYQRFHDFYDSNLIDYLGPMIPPQNLSSKEGQEVFDEQVIRLAKALFDRILYASAGQRQLYQGLSAKRFEELAGRVISFVLLGEADKTIFLDKNTQMREILGIPRGHRNPSSKLSVGVVTFKDRDGPSLSNRPHVVAMREYLASREIRDVDFEIFDLQFVGADELLQKHFDILVLDARQESLPAFLQGVERLPFSKLADYVLVAGSYLSSPDTAAIVRQKIKDKLPRAFIADRESEPALAGLAEFVLNPGMPILLAPNLTISTSVEEVRTQDERTDISFLKQGIYPFTEELKKSPWFNYFVEMSRGCYFAHCTFCQDWMLHGRGWRPYPVENAIQVFRELNLAGIGTVFTFDKSFWGDDLERAEKIARGLIAIGNKVRYTVALRADDVIQGEYLLELFKQSGMSLVFIGPESYEENTLRRFAKGTDAATNLEAIRILREHHIDFGLGFIIDPLSTIDELAHSLTIMSQGELWRNTTSMFNFLRVKHGTGYQKMTAQEGLLGAFDEGSLTYATGFRDTRMAALSRHVQETYQWLPRLSFIFILAKRRNPGQTPIEQKEREKYTRYFEMLQKTDFDFLNELVDALRSQQLQRIDKIKADYTRRYKEVVDEILKGLDLEYPVSRNVYDYIREQLRVKASNPPIPLLPFPERVRQAYREAQDKVDAMMRENRLPEPYLEKDEFNLSIVSGAKDVSGELSDLQPATLKTLESLSQQISRAFPGLYTPMPAGRMRLSLFNYAVNQAPVKWSEIKRHPAILGHLEKAVGSIGQYFPFEVQLQGLMVTENGAVIAMGYVQNGNIEEIRRILAKQFPDAQRDTHLDKPFIAVNIGRITGAIPPDIFKEFVGKVRTHGDDGFGSLIVNRPVLQASRDLSGLSAHPEAQEALKPFNERLIRKGPRILLADMYSPPSVFGSAGTMVYRFPLTLSTLKGAVAWEHGQAAEVDLWDWQQDADSDAFIQRIKRGHYDVVGLSIRIGDEAQAQEILDRIHNEILPEDRPLILLGNSLPGQNPKDYLAQYPEVIVVRGEGERALNGLVRYVRGEVSLQEIPNITYKDQATGEIRDNPIVPMKPEDFVLPSLDFLDKAARLNGLVQWEASRGCPWGICSFCNRLNIVKGWRPFPLELVFEGLEQMQKRGINEVFWADEDFISGDYDRAIAFAEGIKDRKIHIKSIISTSVKSIYSKNETPQLRKKRIQALLAFREAGVHSISLGLESGSNSQLKRYLKGITAEENREAVKRLRELGFKVISGFIMFDPLMTVSEVQQNLEFVTELGLEDHIYLFGKLRFADANPWYREKVKAEGLLEGKQPDQVHYRYRFKDPGVSIIVAITRKWRQARDGYNETLNHLLQNYPQQGRSITENFYGLQNAIRRFDVSFLKLASMAFETPADETVFMRSLLLTGFSQADLDEMRRVLQEIRSDKSPFEEQKAWKDVMALVLEKRTAYILSHLATTTTASGSENTTRDMQQIKGELLRAVYAEEDQLVKLFDLPLSSELKPRSEIRTLTSLPYRADFQRSENRENITMQQVSAMVWRSPKSVQPAMVFLDSEDWRNLSQAQQQEYFFAVLSRSETRIIVYNERGQVHDGELAALLKLDRVTRTGGDLEQAVISFSRLNVPAIHLSKQVLPSQTLVGGLRKRVAFFKTNSGKSGTLATALLWAISGGENVRFQGVHQEDGFWTVDETLLDAIQRTYENNFIIATAA